MNVSVGVNHPSYTKGTNTSSSQIAWVTYRSSDPTYYVTLRVSRRTYRAAVTIQRIWLKLKNRLTRNG